MTVVSSGQLTLTDLNDTKQLILYLNANYKSQIYDPTASSYSPSFSSTNLIVTPELYIAGGDGSNLMPSSQVKSLTWYEGSQTTTALAETATTGTTGAGYTYNIPTGTVITTAKPLTIKSNLSGSQKYTCVLVYTDADTSFDVTIKADIEIIRVQNGAKGNTGNTGSSGTNAVLAVLTNESHTIPTDSAGNNGNYTSSGTDIYVYEGATALTYDGVGTSNSTWKVTAVGTSITAGTLTDGGTFATYGNASAISADVAYITFTITGKTANGTAINITKKQTLSRVKAGTNGSSGTSPTLYRLIPSANAIQKSISGAYNPTRIVLTGKSQTGSGTYGDWSGAVFKIYTTTDTTIDNATSWGTAVETSSAGATYTYPATGSIPAGITGVKIDMLNGATIVDTQILPVVKDGVNGTNGVDAYYLNVWTPNGDTIRNGTGSLTLQADLYKGSVTVTPTAFKWYIQDATATTASGGDADGGNGWRLLTSTNASTYGVTNYTTAIMTVTGVGINGVEGFKCVATYTNKYSGVVVVKDFQDPISVNILGANIFKNGTGSVTLTAQLIQAGAEVATTGYTFAWSLYSTSGSLIKTLTGATDTITVNATDVTGIANVVCDVSK